MSTATRTDSSLRSTVREVVPQKLAHFVIRTSRFAEMLAWYRTVFHAKTAFENPVIAFLSYDDEHHRFAFLNTSHLPGPERMYTGFDHVAFTYADLSDLMATYERLKGQGIMPFWCINHGPTTSMYYRDPDSNELEFQVDNYETAEEANAFFFSTAFAANPIGIDFDPELMLNKLRRGVPSAELLRQGAAPVQPGAEHVYTTLPPPPKA